ncbi:MAG: c-type cytochrome [Myxococcales bacterium]|nr:c-type cytochrome [Myxococcales bacterium]
MMDSQWILAAGAGLVLLLGVGAAAQTTGPDAAEQAAGAGAPAQAAETPTLDGATLYAQRTCIACHGPDAKTPILPEYPKLAGQNAPYMLRQVLDIKSGARSNGNTAAMRGVLHLVTEDEIKVLVEYLSGLQP